MKSNSYDLARELYDGWSVVDVAFRLQILPKFSDLDLTSAQFEVLFALDHFKDQDASIKDLAKLSLKSSSAITQLIAGLEEQELVQRVHSTTDRRVVHVKLTSKGSRKFEEAHQLIVQSVQETISNLSEAEIKEYIRINNKIAESIQ